MSVSPICSQVRTGLVPVGNTWWAYFLHPFGLNFGLYQYRYHLARIFRRFEISFSFNSVDFWRYIIIWRTWYFDSLQSHTIVRGYFSYHLHRPHELSTWESSCGILYFLHIVFICGGIILYGLFSFICIHIQTETQTQTHILSTWLSLPSPSMSSASSVAVSFINLTFPNSKNDYHLFCDRMMLWPKRQMMFLNVHHDLCAGSSYHVQPTGNPDRLMPS